MIEMHVQAFKIRVMLRLCGSSYILFTIFAASTIIAVAAKNCNGNYEYVDDSMDNPLRDGKMKVSLKKKKGNAILVQGPSNDMSKSLPSVPLKEPKKRRRCCPYDFDSKRCKIVDDRVLCGYNRNGNWPKSKDSVVEMHGGCRLRGGRLECGYQRGPYTNARRPPVWDNPSVTDRDVGKP